MGGEVNARRAPPLSEAAGADVASEATCGGFLRHERYKKRMIR